MTAYENYKSQMQGMFSPVTEHLQAKINLYLILATTLLLFSLGVYDYTSTRENLNDELQSLATTTTNRLQTSLALPLWQLDEETLSRIVTSEMENPNIRAITLLDHENQVVVANERDDALQVAPDRLITSGAHIDLFGKHIGSVRVQVTPQLMDRTLGAAIWQIGLRIAGINIILVLVLALLLRRSLTRPILALVHTVREVSNTRDYSLRARAYAPDELGKLAAKINEMLAEIQDRDRKLHLYNEKLESLVAERTTRLEAANRELTRAKENAEHGNQAKSQFLANMSHEIRTPLNAIIGMADIAMQSDPTSKQRGYLDIIANSSRSLLGLINDILDFSKVEAGKMELEQTTFDLYGFMEELTDIYLERCAEKSIELILEIHPDTPRMVVGDPLRLRQVLVNLTANAVKFTDEGEVHVKVMRVQTGDRGLELFFSVRDTGIGIEPQVQKRLFNAFTQADSSYTRKYGGTGLGLAISHKLVDLMGGSISLFSEKDKGSTFTFTSHMQPADANTDSSTKGTPRTYPLALPRAVRGRRALVLEENTTVARVLRETLGAMGMSTEVVTTPQEVLHRISLSGQAGERSFHLLLVDPKLSSPPLPGTEHMDLHHLLTSDPTLASLPCIELVDFRLSDSTEHDPTRKDAAHWRKLAKPVKPTRLHSELLAAFGMAPAPLTHATPASVAPRFDGLHLLLVEDNVFNQQVAREMLTMAGCSLQVATNGLEALDALASNRFDAVLMDIEMPVMNGFQAAEAIRDNPAYKELPIIAMTAHALADYKTRCFACGMNDYIAKPIDRDELHRVLTTWLKPTDEPHSSSRPRTLSADVQAALQAYPQLTRISGLDAPAGLSRVGGNLPAYARLVHDILESYNDADERLHDLIVNGQLEEAHHLAHDIKGVAGNIGADELQRAAGELDGAILASMPLEEDDTAFTHKQDARPLPDMSSRIVAITTALYDLHDARELTGRILTEAQAPQTCAQAPQSELSREEFAPLFMELTRQIGDRDPVAVEESLASLRSRTSDFEGLRGLYAGADLPGRLTRLTRALDDFDFDTAEEIVADMAQRCAIHLDTPGDTPLQ